MNNYLIKGVVCLVRNSTTVYLPIKAKDKESAKKIWREWVKEYEHELMEQILENNEIEVFIDKIEG